MIGCGAPQSPSTSQTQLEFENTVVGLGVVEPGENEFRIPLRNSGDADLNIRTILASCACTVPNQPKERIPPGSEYVLTGTVDAKSGPGSAILRVFANTSASPHKIFLEWFGKGNPVVVSEALSFSLWPGETDEKEIRVAYPGGDARHMLVLESVTGLPDEIRIAVGETEVRAIENEAILSDHPVTAIMKLSATAVAPEHAVRKKVTAKLHLKQSEQDYVVDLPIRLHVSGQLEANPPRVIVAADSMSEMVGKVRRVILSTREANQSVRLLKSPAFVKATIQPLVDSEHKHLLEIRVDSVPPDQVSSHCVELCLEGDAESAVEVPLSLAVTQPAGSPKVTSE